MDNKLYVGLVKYKLTKDKIVDEHFRIGFQPTKDEYLIHDWKEKTQQLEHVAECQVYEIINKKI